MTFCYHAVLRNGKSHSDAQKLYYREICSLKEGKKKKTTLKIRIVNLYQNNTSFQC